MRHKHTNRFLTAILAGLMLFSLIGCGSKDTAQSGGSSSTDDTDNGSFSSSNDTSDTGSFSSSNDTSDTQTTQSGDTLGDFDTSATISETVLYDENNIKITANRLTYGSNSVDLEITIENNSDKDLSFYSNSNSYGCNSVNGYMVSDGYLNCDVAAGKKANDSLNFKYSNLMLYGINKIADMEIGFSIADDDYNYIRSGPRQIITNAYDGYDYSVDTYQNTIVSDAAKNTYNYEMLQFSEDSQYDVNGTKLLSSGVMVNQDGEYALLLELENTTSNMVFMYTTDIVLNGLTIYDSTWSIDAINPGKRGLINVKLSSVLEEGHLEAYGISDVGTVDVSLIQKDVEGSELSETAVVTVSVPGATGGYDSSGTEVYNNDGLRIISKTILEAPSEYGSYDYVLLLIENNSGSVVTIDDAYDSLSVNGYMTDYFFYSKEVDNGKSAAVEIELIIDSLEANGITAVSDITEVEIGFKIKKDGNTIDEPVVTMNF